MQKKGTGWIPDLPDVRDYNLFTGSIQDIVETSSSEASTQSLETLAHETTEALRELLKSTPSEQAQTLLAKLEQSQQALLNSGTFFQPVRVHQYLDQTTNSPEVVRIKAYLKEFILKLDSEGLPTAPKNASEQASPEYTLIKALKSDFNWWLGPQVDERFTQLVAFYQRWIEQHQVPVIQPQNRPRYRGYIDPETLAFFEKGPNESFYEKQVQALEELSKEIQNITQVTVDEFNEQFRLSKVLDNEFYNLDRISVDFIDLQKRFGAIQKQYYRRYVEAVVPKESLDLIQTFEDLRLQAYPEPNGLWIIGYGHRISACPNRSITETEARDLLEKDLIKLIVTLGPEIQKKCSRQSFAAILSLAHHIGKNAFLSSSLFTKLQGKNDDDNIESVAKEFEEWSNSKPLGLSSFEKPLQKRRSAERLVFLGQSYSLSSSENNSLDQVHEPDVAAKSLSYYEQYNRSVSALLKDFKDALDGQIAAYKFTIERVKENYPVIQRKMMASPLPHEVSQGIFQGIMAVVKRNFQPGDLQVAKDSPYLQKLLDELGSSDQGDAHQESSLRDGYKKELIAVVEQFYDQLIKNDIFSVNDPALCELRELLDPLIQSLMRLFSPMGIHTNIHRSIANAVIQFQDFLDYQKRIQTEGRNPLSLVKNQPLDEVSQGRIVAALQEAKQRAEQQLFIAQTVLKEATNRQDYAFSRVDPSLAITKLAKLFLMFRIIEKIQGYCLSPEPSPQHQKVDYQPQPTLLFVPPPDRSRGTDRSAPIRDFSDALQMPISCHLRRELQQFFREQERSETQGKTWLYLSLPEIVDLSYWCSAIEDQGQLNACTAHAGVALVEYFTKKAFGRYEDLSRLFLYKVARNLMNRLGDAGASVRETMRAMVLFGVPPEDRWPYQEADFDEEPNPFCYAYAQNYQAMKYCRLDRVGMSPQALLAQIKAGLVAGLPCMFGFTAYKSIYDPDNMRQGHIPYPTRNDVMDGGHAVVAVGYDDHHVIEAADGPDRPSVGAILIRNSWGTDWGQGGYGWLPYDYVLGGLTADWWVLLKAEWLNQTSFGGESAAWTSQIQGRNGPRPKPLPRRN